MNPKEYKRMCVELLDKFNQSIEDCIQIPEKGSETDSSDWIDPFENPQQEDLSFIFHPYPNMDEILREFLHLVYSFDSNTPLYKEISKSGSLDIKSKYLDPK